MPTLCASSPIPSFHDLYTAAIGQFHFPPFSFTIPPLPALLNPIYGGLSEINLELHQIIQELQSYQILTTFKSIIQPLVTFVGGALNAILPKIPGTNLNLLDLLSLNPSGLYAAVRSAITAFGASIFALVPSPIFSALSIPAIEIVDTVKMIIKGYMNSLLGVVSNLIGQATSILAIANMAALPTLPTLAQLKSAILANFPGYSDFTALVRSGVASVQQLFSLSLPGFGSLPSLPSPLIPNFSSLEVEFMEGLNIAYTELIATPLRQIKSFIDSVLSHFIGFSFPTLCISF